MATSINLLRVPIRVDALYAPTAGVGCQLGAFAADFSQLPFHATDGILNVKNPNFSLTLVQSLPSSLTFPPGLHLHWALPDALTNGRHDGSGTRFPAVPNRWLVRRFDGKRALQKAWVVESDFLHPCNNEGIPQALAPPADQGHPITAWPSGLPIMFPTKRFPLSNNQMGAAFRYMGRSLLLSDWLNHAGGGSDQYLNQDANSTYKLTALGYGEPSFAAYYPNCYSVFGFCDCDPTLDGSASYEYEIIGWFHEAELDPLQSKEFKDQLPDDPARFTAMAKEYRWLVSDDDRKRAFPAQMVGYASLKVVPAQVTPWQASDHDKVDIAIGNTGGEALSALLATEFAKDQASGDQDRAEIKRIAEDQLEAMNLASSLQGASVDFAAQFAQARHQRGFRGIRGGTRWAVLPKPTKPDSAAQADATPQPPLPDVVAHALDALNTAQEAYDMGRQEIVELRYQAFFDWHCYLEARYSNNSHLLPYFNQLSNMEDFIRATSLQLLKDKLAVVGKLDVTQQQVTAEDADGSRRATLDLGSGILSPPNPETPELANLAIQTVLRLKALMDAMSAAKLLDRYVLSNRAAESFWQPREPVVLLSGPPAISTDRHGEDGELLCGVVAMPGAPGTAEFIANVDMLKPAQGDLSLQSQAEPPWHPIILEWEVDVNTSSEGRTSDRDIDPDMPVVYAPKYVTGPFQIPENEPDFSPMKSLPTLLRQGYNGRCSMTPTAGEQLDVNLTTFLLKTTLYDCRDRSSALKTDDLNRLIAWYELKHAAARPPSEPAARVAWSKLQRPFVADGPGQPVLLPIADLATWCEAKPVSGGSNATFGGLPAKLKAQDPPYVAIQALLRRAKMTVLSQALGGFNSALLTRERVLQIPIEDPVGYVASLTGDIASAVGRHHPVAPLLYRIYSPIRLGGLTLAGLRLLDTFGQSWQAPLQGAHLVKCNEFTAPDLKDPNFTYLPPRFAPPLRLNFRWLAALSGRDGFDEVEMNSAPATSPICGWVLANHLDDSLMVYDAKGQALGAINFQGLWLPAPGLPTPIASDEIANPNLRRLVRRLVIAPDATEDERQLGQKFLSTFLDVLDGAAETIEPASFAQHEALALLMGRPIAVVRARVDLQVMGQPTVSETVDDPTIAGGKAIVLKKSEHWKAFSAQGWDVFVEDWGQFYGCCRRTVWDTTCPFDQPRPLAEYERTTYGFEKVAVPVRLGEHQLLNDGLVGYWKETPDGDLDNVFHSPQTPDDLQIIEDVDFYHVRATQHCIRARKSGEVDEFGMALADEPQALTLLMDPRGVLHATCGVLPVSKLEIPSAYYAETLKHIGITFRVSPLLTDSEQLHAAVPAEAGYRWSWVTKPSGSTWDETGDIVDATEHAHFFRQPKVVEGWLKLSPTPNK